jgi:hypothetical protein
LRKDSLFKNGVGKIGHPHAKKMVLDTDLTPFTTINSKRVRDLSANKKQ